MSVAVDTDLLLKGARYRLLGEMLRSLDDRIGILGAAPFILRNRLGAEDPAWLAAEALLLAVEHMEPNPEEVAQAADLEVRAARQGLALDEGESLLCAMVMGRCIDLLATGDKRAIRAIHGLLGCCEPLRVLSGRVVCLEQIFLRLLKREDPGLVRARVCKWKDADRALTSCFACYSETTAAGDWAGGLSSYIGSLASEVPGLLSPE